MMPVMRISEETWHRLKRFAEPLEDTADDALRKALDGAEAHRDCRKVRTTSSTVTPAQSFPTSAPAKAVPDYKYEPVIIEVLKELGNRSDVGTILNIVEQKMKGLLGPADYEPKPRGGLRWRNRAQWARFKLVKRGVLKGNSPRGIWELA